MAKIKTALSIGALKRASRMYNSNKDAARALGVHPTTVNRLWKKHGIETHWKKGDKSYE